MSGDPGPRTDADDLPGSARNPFVDATHAAVAIYGASPAHLPKRTCRGCGSGPWWVDGLGEVRVGCFPAGVMVGPARVTWARIRRARRGLHGRQLGLPL